MFTKRTLALTILLLVLASFLSGCFRSKAITGAADLTFYGLDNSDVMDPIIAKYREINPDVKIKYKKFNDPVEYENLIVNEIAEGEGPDIFYVHNTWLPRHTKKLVSLDSQTLTPQNLTDSFVNVVVDDFVQPDPQAVKKIYALPLYVDTLALYYNKADYEQKIPERGKPATTWEGIKTDADKFLTQDADTKELTHGEIALGLADNIKLAPDIIYNFFLQAGVSFYSADYKQATFAGGGKDVFELFTSFAKSQNKNFSWSATAADPESKFSELDAFLSGKVSAVLAYSDLYPRLETELKNANSRLGSAINLKDIKIAKVPQIAEKETDYKAWANYYGLAVSRNTKSPKTSWDFVQFATSQENSRQYHEKTKRPTARRDLIEEQKKEPVTDVFVSQVGYAGSYRIFSDDKFAQALRDAINAVSAGVEAPAALNAAETKINEILKIMAPDGLYPQVVKNPVKK